MAEFRAPEARVVTRSLRVTVLERFLVILGLPLMQGFVRKGVGVQLQIGRVCVRPSSMEASAIALWANP